MGIWRGEVDAIGHTSWRFGFARHQTFALFDCEQLLVEISQHQGIPGIVLYTASVEQSSEYFNIVTHSANELSEQNNEDSLHKGRTEQQCLDSLHGFIPLAHVADVRMRIRGCTKLLAVGTNEKDGSFCSLFSQYSSISTVACDCKSNKPIQFAGKIFS